MSSALARLSINPASATAASAVATTPSTPNALPRPKISRPSTLDPRSRRESGVGRDIRQAENSDDNGDSDDNGRTRTNNASTSNNNGSNNNGNPTEDRTAFLENLSRQNPHAIFKKFDVDNSNSISFEEFRTMMPMLGINMSVPKMLKYFRMCDTDGSGEIDFEEFKIALFACDPDSGNPVGFSPNSLLTPLDAFEMFDEDSTGVIDEDSFFFVLEYLGLKVSDEKQEEMFNRFDVDGSGTIDYNEFKQVWLLVGNTKKELLDRGIALPKFASKIQLQNMLEVILDDEEERERMSLAEADRWRRWQAVIVSKTKYIALAQRRAEVELRAALDCAGQVYVFGGGTFGQFDGDVRREAKDGSKDMQEGFDQIAELWHRRVRPGQEVGARNNEGNVGVANADVANAAELAEALGATDPLAEAASSNFHYLNASVNTCALWGKRTKELAISSNVIFALTDLGEIYSWGGNDHWWHSVEPESYWADNWRGDTTPRSSKLLMTQNARRPEEEDATGGVTFVSKDDGEADRLKVVCQYYNVWRPPPGGEDRLSFVKASLLPLVKFEHVQLSVRVRGKPCEGATKNEMVDTLYTDFTLEKRVLGERAHRQIRELEVEIVDLTKRKKTAMAKKIQLTVNDMWRPLRDLQVESSTSDHQLDASERQAQYTLIEEGYEKWYKHLVESRENMQPEFTARGNSYDFGISGTTARATDVHTPRGYATCVSVAAGADHACAIHQNGQLYMWGLGNSGRLGLDDTENGDPRADAARPKLVQALNGKPVIRASLGGSHSAAIVSGGELYVWGSAGSGKLGLGELTMKQECYCSVPTRLLMPNVTNFKSKVRRVKRVSCGANHTACVGQGGELYVWGCGDGGRLGLGRDQLTTQHSPVLVAALKHETMSNVSCGYFQTLVSTAVQDSHVGEGQAKNKQLNGGRLYVAGPANVLGQACFDFTQYSNLAGSDTTDPVIVRQISAGFGHQACVTGSGELLTWGANANGCCGHSTLLAFIPKPSTVKCLYVAPSNVASGCACRQSSMYGNYDAHLGVEGSKEGVLTKKQCIHTQQDAQPWWEVDLSSACTVSTIKLWNRTDEPTDRSVERDKFTARLFPVHVLIGGAPFPDGVGGDNLRTAIAQCSARVRFTEDQRCSTWQLPENTTGRYVRVQLEGFNFLHFSKIEVFGTYGTSQSLGRVGYAVAGKHVTAAVIRPAVDPRDVERAYGRAVKADCYNADILRQFETFAVEFNKVGRGTQGQAEGQGQTTKLNGNDNTLCILCKPPQLCETCMMRTKHGVELLKMPLGPGGRLRRLSSIKDFLLDADKPPLNYKSKRKVVKKSVLGSIGGFINSRFGGVDDVGRGSEDSKDGDVEDGGEGESVIKRPLKKIRGSASDNKKNLKGRKAKPGFVSRFLGRGKKLRVEQQEEFDRVEKEEEDIKFKVREEAKEVKEKGKEKARKKKLDKVQGKGKGNNNGGSGGSGRGGSDEDEESESEDDGSDGTSGSSYSDSSGEESSDGE